MKHILSLLCLIIWTSLFPSNWLKVYNIDGTEKQLDDHTTRLIICYSSPSCHQCMEALVHYCGLIASQNQHCQCAVLIKGDDIFSMRMETTFLEEYIPDTTVMPICYDSNPCKRKRFFKKKKMRYSPALLVIDKDNHYHFFSYESLFDDEQGLVKCFDKIERIIGNETN